MTKSILKYTYRTKITKEKRKIRTLFTSAPIVTNIRKTATIRATPDLRQKAWKSSKKIPTKAKNSSSRQYFAHSQSLYIAKVIIIKAMKNTKQRSFAISEILIPDRNTTAFTTTLSQFVLVTVVYYNVYLYIIIAHKLYAVDMIKDVSYSARIRRKSEIIQHMKNFPRLSSPLSSYRISCCFSSSDGTGTFVTSMCELHSENRPRNMLHRRIAKSEKYQISDTVYSGGLNSDV